MAADRSSTTEPMKQQAGGAFFRENVPLLVTAALVILVCVYVRVRLLSVPLERDEGEFAYFAQLMLHGIPPYLKAYTLKLPGAAVMYALFMGVFGQTASAIHLGLLVVNILNAGMLFFIARRLFDPVTGTAAAASYALLSLGQGVLGVFAHATHFVVLFALAGFLLLFRAVERGRPAALFFSGLSFGMAMVMKQHGVFFAVFALLYFLREQRDRLPGGWPRLARQGMLLAAAMALPYVVCLLLLFGCGTFPKFWFWTVDYAREYVSRVTLTDGLKSFLRHFAYVSRNALFLWIAAGAGAIVLFTDRETNRGRGFVAGLLIFSSLAVCTGFYFRYHYFVMLLPAVALLIGIAAAPARNVLARTLPGPLSRIIPPLLFLTVVSLTVYREREVFFALEPVAVCKLIYNANPFAESPHVARYIREHTSPDDSIAVLGSEPQIYFYADRVSATGHIYTYGLMENQKYAPAMQAEMIREIEAARPKFIVAVNVYTSWLNTPYSYPLLVDWTRMYLKEHYQRVGIADIIDKTTTVYRWDRDVEGYYPDSKTYLDVFRRKE